MNSLSIQHAETLLGRRRVPAASCASARRPEPAWLVDGLPSVREALARYQAGRRERWGALKCLVAESAYWYDHPQGPTNAEGHAERLEKGPHGWAISFGANKFLVERAFDLCVDEIRGALDRAEATGIRPLWSELKADLEGCVFESVADCRGELYRRYPATDRMFMKFGASAVHVAAYVQCLHEKLALHRAFA